MQLPIFALTFAALAAASPVAERAPIDLCPALDSPQCCETDVATVLDLTCSAPSWGPKSTKDFKAGCAKEGKTAVCCTLPVDGDALLCDEV